MEPVREQGADDDPTMQWWNAVNQESLDGVDNEVRMQAGILPLVVEADLSFVGGSATMQPSISIKQFFDMMGVKFMDELAAPRRSTICPSQSRRRGCVGSGLTGVAGRV
jgi:hypothetical protein